MDGGSSSIDGGAAWCLDAPAMYVQAGSDGGCGDKRRRLVPGMLAHCLRPEIPAAVPEAAEVEEEAPAACQSTPGRTPKRKLAARRSPTPAAASADEHAAAAAEASEEAVQEAAGVAQHSPERFATFRLLESRWHGGSPLPSPQPSPPLSARRHLRRRGVCSIM